MIRTTERWELKRCPTLSNTHTKTKLRCNLLNSIRGRIKLLVSGCEKRALIVVQHHWRNDERRVWHECCKENCSLLQFSASSCHSKYCYRTCCTLLYDQSIVPVPKFIPSKQTIAMDLDPTSQGRVLVFLLIWNWWLTPSLNYGDDHLTWPTKNDLHWTFGRLFHERLWWLHDHFCSKQTNNDFRTSLSGKGFSLFDWLIGSLITFAQNKPIMTFELHWVGRGSRYLIDWLVRSSIHSVGLFVEAPQQAKREK